MGVDGGQMKGMKQIYRAQGGLDEDWQTKSSNSERMICLCKLFACSDRMSRDSSVSIDKDPACSLAGEDDVNVWAIRGVIMVKRVSNLAIPPLSSPCWIFNFYKSFNGIYGPYGTANEQAYAHKILTGRGRGCTRSGKHQDLQDFPRETRVPMMPLAPATVPPASPPHSVRKNHLLLVGCAINDGMAVGRDLSGKANNVIAVIGDGAMTAGQAYEAMNNAGYLDSNLIIVLNDNRQVSLPTATVDGPAPPVGALSSKYYNFSCSIPPYFLRPRSKDLHASALLPSRAREKDRGTITGVLSIRFISKLEQPSF
ncbi:hypothetical protein H6P81_006118 [Aristolochia fimbriata]|uniref:Uncharacterized protein n=1 Tax=Aristolochia fimbriata TaxID=158543 RepID=A0AAV7EXK8_ARIFI|nr:hypothetical protein H6P81_006118 [Aristolochia fimbriata]